MSDPRWDDRTVGEICFYEVHDPDAIADATADMLRRYPRVVHIQSVGSGPEKDCIMLMGLDSTDANL